MFHQIRRSLSAEFFGVHMATMKIITLVLFLCIEFPLPGYAEGLLAVDNPAKNGQEQKVYASLQAFVANDQVALSQYGSDWQGDYAPRAGSNLGLLSARAEGGVQWQGFRLGGLYRAEALVKANRDTSDLVRQYTNSSGYDVGRTYQLDLKIKGFEASGSRLSRSFQLDLGGPWQLDWGLGLSYLRGKRIKLETLSGQLVALNTQDLNASASLNDTDSQINITDLAQFNAPYGRLATPFGEGYALDAGMVLQQRESGFSVELAVADLAGSIEWKNLPDNVANINTANKYYDANGNVQFNPSATRISSYQNMTQHLDAKLWLAVNYALGDYELQGATNYTDGYWFPQAGVKYQINPQWGVNADYDFRFNSVGVALRHHWLYIGLRTDNTSIDKAKAYGLNIGNNIPF